MTLLFTVVTDPDVNAARMTAIRWTNAIRFHGYRVSHRRRQSKYLRDLCDYNVLVSDGCGVDKCIQNEAFEKHVLLIPVKPMNPNTRKLKKSNMQSFKRRCDDKP
jgi:hypothetical protein